VAVYRLLTVGSVEIEMMEAQISKKKLERLSITGGDFRKAGRRSRGEMTTEGLRRLLADDVKDIQRRHGGEEGGGEGGVEGDIEEEELERILDRKGMFEEGGLSVEGRMYDLVVIGGSDLLSGISQGGRE
jgi:ATP-dependent DNA helicase